MKRRSFLKYTIPSVIIPALIGGFKLQAVAGEPMVHSLLSTGANDRVLVVIQLAGGNDGLNTVIPIEYYADYKNARSNIAIVESKILKLNGNDKTGLNHARHAAIVQRRKISHCSGCKLSQTKFFAFSGH